MSATITFDTLSFMDELKRSGMDQEHAEAITKATAKALSQALEANSIATKRDISDLKDLIHSNTWKIISTLSITQGLFMTLFTFIQHTFLK
jgi:Protein of unknown function (DUF1640)